MKKSLRILSLLLVLVMLVSMVACTNTKPITSSDDPQATGSQEPITLTIGLVQKVNVESYDDNELTKWLEEQTGYNIEFMLLSSDHAEAITQLTAMMAGGEKLPDILYGINGTQKMLPEWGSDGYLIDLTPYLEDKEASATFWERWAEVPEDDAATIMAQAKDPTTGEQYAMPYYSTGYNNRTSTQCYINTAWLEAVGKEMPTNYEELVDVLKAFKTGDPNGNGKADELPMVGGVGLYRANIIQWLLNNWTYVNDSSIDATYFFGVEDGKVYYPQVTEEYREALRNIRQLVEDGLLSTMTWTVSQTSELLNLVTPTDGEAIAGVVGIHASVHIAADSPLMYEYQPLAPFNYAPVTEPIYRLSACITSDCENPDAAFDLLDFMYTEECSWRMNSGVPDVDWEFQTNADGVVGRVQINGDAYSGQTRQTWSFMDSTIINSAEPPYAKLVPAEADKTWKNHRQDLLNNHTALYMEVGAKNNPDEVLYLPSYNAEEVAENGDIETNLKTYIETTRAEFLNGTLNIETDWDKYIKEFYAIGADILLENAQDAYDRSK